MEGRTTRDRVLEYYRQFTAEHGYAPTLRDTASALGLGMTTVRHHRMRLEELGLITIERTAGGSARPGRMEVKG